MLQRHSMSQQIQITCAVLQLFPEVCCEHYSTCIALHHLQCNTWPDDASLALRMALQRQIIGGPHPTPTPEHTKCNILSLPKNLT